MLAKISLLRNQITRAISLNMKNKIYEVYMHGPNGQYTTTTRNETDAEEAERLERKKKYIADSEYKINNTEELLCDKCGGVMGRVYANDLNGSGFYHSECIA